MYIAKCHAPAVEKMPNVLNGLVFGVSDIPTLLVFKRILNGKHRNTKWSLNFSGITFTLTAIRATFNLKPMTETSKLDS